MGIGIPGRDIGFVQFQSLVKEFLRDRVGLREFFQQIGHRMSPRLCSHFLKHGFDRFFCGLLGRKASPFVKTVFGIALGVS